MRQEELDQLRASRQGGEEDAEDAAGPRRAAGSGGAGPGPKSHNSGGGHSHVLLPGGFGAVPRYLKEEADAKSESSDQDMGNKGDDATTDAGAGQGGGGYLAGLGWSQIRGGGPWLRPGRW